MCARARAVAKYEVSTRAVRIECTRGQDQGTLSHILRVPAYMSGTSLIPVACTELQVCTHIAGVTFLGCYCIYSSLERGVLSSFDAMSSQNPRYLDRFRRLVTVLRTGLTDIIGSARACLNSLMEPMWLRLVFRVEELK